MTTPTATEIKRRNRYWFEHWQDFTMEVVVSEPVERSGFVGGELGHFFGAAPIPFNSQITDRGTFRIHADGTAWVFASRKTYVWDLNNTHVVTYDDGVQMRTPNQPVIFIRGPVAAPIVGAMAALGYPVTLP